MSLETLLEAAKYLEWHSQTKARGDEPSQEFHQYAKQAPPAVFDREGRLDEGREKRRAGGAGTREVHNKLEKNRRAHLKECFEYLKLQIPTMEDKKTSNLSILRGSLRYIQTLRRKEKDYDVEIQTLARQKTNLQERIGHLKTELSRMNIEVDFKLWMHDGDEDSNSTSTVTEGGNPIMSEEDEEEEVVTSVPASSASTVSPQATATTALSSTTGPTVSMVTTTAAFSTTEVPVVRPPVTQILHQTLTQRQALQKQQLSCTSHVTSVQASTLRSAPQIIKTVTPLRGSGTSMMPTGVQVSGFNKAATAATTVPVTTIAKVGSASLVMASGSAPRTQVKNILTTGRSIPTATTQSMLTSSIRTMQSHSASNIVTHTVPSVSSVAAMATMKQIIAPATPQLLSGGQLAAINPLLAQTMPRTSAVGQMLTAVSNIAGAPVLTTTTTHVSSVHPVMSLAHMTPVTQIVSPMTVMSPTVHVTPNLSQTQLNHVLTQPLLKSISQIPTIIQPQFLQANQMVGQSVVKPLVMVTVPTPPPVQVTVAVTPTTT